MSENSTEFVKGNQLVGSLSVEDNILAVRDKIRQERGYFVKSKEFVYENVLRICSTVSIIAIGLIFFFLFREGLNAFQEASLRDFVYNMNAVYEYDAALDETVLVGERLGFEWQPVSVSSIQLSFVPLLWGSFQIALLASVMSTIFGIAGGIYLAELASHRTRGIIKPALELMVGIPTVVLGFFMLAILASPLKNLADSIGLEAIYANRFNAFVGAIGVSIVIVPVIASLVDDSLRAVPGDLRAASFGLGATRWQTIWRVVLPAGVSGVIAAVILGFGRAFGETMIVLMCTGNTPQISGNPFESVRTMTATIASEMGAAPYGGLQANTLFLLGAFLVSITFVLNLIVEIITNRYRRKIRL